MYQHGMSDRSEWGAHQDEMALMTRFLTSAGERLEAIPPGERRWWYDDATGRPETAGDHETWAAFVDAVGEAFPGDGVTSMLGAVEPAGSRLWTIIPIDGTFQYVTGYPLWAVGIALVIDGTPVASAITFPACHALYTALRERGHAFCNGRPITVSGRAPGFVSGGWWGAVRRSATLLDMLSLGMLAGSPGGPLCPITTLSRGRAVIDGGLAGTIYNGDSAHCVAPLVPLLGALGMVVTDAEGGQQRYDRPINGAVIAHSPAAHARLLMEWRQLLESLDDSFDDVGFTPATAGSLERAGITTFGVLRVRGAAALRADGFSETIIAELRTMLAIRGHRMRD
jgi:fructose-1,6-bisphosphatase/inositol monophosphatase family enzyme